MRYTTFRTLVMLGGVAVIIAGMLALRLPSRRTAAPGPPPIPESARTGGDTLRQVDRMILSYLETHPTLIDRVKDAFPRERFEVNLYRDGADQCWSRLKIDLNREDRDDEKWTLSDGRPWKRQVSTHDNEHYDQEYLWHNDHWVQTK